MDSPCHHCDERDDTCHGKCEEYKIFAAKMKELSHKRRLDTDRNWEYKRNRGKRR